MMKSSKEKWCSKCHCHSNLGRSLMDTLYVLQGVPPVYWFPSTAVAPYWRNKDSPIARIGFPGCFSIKGEVLTPIEPPIPKVITGLTYQDSLSLFDTSVWVEDRNDSPLTMEISVANLIEQEGCCVRLKAESWDLQLSLHYAQPRLVNQNLVLSSYAGQPMLW